MKITAGGGIGLFAARLFDQEVDGDPGFSGWNTRGRRLYAISWLPGPDQSVVAACGRPVDFDGGVVFIQRVLLARDPIRIVLVRN